jgi:hypothetical protein
MKTFISLLFVLLPATGAYARKVLLSPGAGIVYTSTNALLRNNVYAQSPRGQVSAFGGFKLAMVFSKIQVGVGIQYGGQANSYTAAIDSGTIKGMMEYESVGKFLAPYVFANRTFRFHGADVYAGVNVGYSENVFHSVYIRLGERSFGSKVAVPQYKLIRAGLQFGYNYRVASNCLLFAEAGINYLAGEIIYPVYYGTFKPADMQGNTSFWQVPIMAGVSLEMR